jgi:hypothetical protein
MDGCSQDNMLNLTVIRFTPEGRLKEISAAGGSFLQLCPGSWTTLDKGLRFGARYQRSCTMPARQLIQSRDTEFLDLYLKYWEGGQPLLYAIPVLTLDLKQRGKSPNKVQNGELMFISVRIATSC